MLVTITGKVMKQILDSMTVYRPFGQPAWATVQFKSIPSSGDTVTIAGTVFTYGTDFSGAVSPVRAAEALKAAINSDIEYSYANTTKQPIRTFSAWYYNDTVFVYATAPGTAGNAMTLATSNSAAINISGATFANGTDGTASIMADSTPMPVALTDGSGTLTTGGTAQQVFAANANRRYLLVQNVSAENMWVNLGAVATQAAGSILLFPGGTLEYDGASVPSGLISIIGTTTGDGFTAKQA
jgi:hypothetical protein